MSQYTVDLTHSLSFSTVVEAASQDEAIELAKKEASEEYEETSPEDWEVDYCDDDEEPCDSTSDDDEEEGSPDEDEE